MERYTTGSKVRGGYYWNVSKWDIVAVSGEQGELTGDGQDRFIRLPLLVMVTLAVAVSFVFVVFLPLIGFVLFFHALFVGAVGLGKRLLSHTATGVAPGWQPGEAHLAGRPEDSQPGKGEASEAEPLEALKKEIDEKRNAENEQGPRRL
jgi:hypothetical protein